MEKYQIGKLFNRLTIKQKGSTMKKLIILALFVLGICCFTTFNVSADEGDAPKKAKKEKKEKAPMVEMTITGKITKVERKGKGDKVSAAYFLTDAEGNKYSLPSAAKKTKKEAEGEEAPANYDEFLDVNVKVVAQGNEKTVKDKKSIQIKKVVSIEKVAAE